MAGFRSMLPCFGQERRDGYTEVLYDEKTALYSDDEPCPEGDNEPYVPPEAMSYYEAGAAVNEKDTRTAEQIAREVAWLLWRAEWNDDALQGRISDAVGGGRWNRRLVECLDNVIEYVEQGRRHMGAAMCEALDKATDMADEEFCFPRRHPESLDGFIAIVSAGVLAEMLGAWVLELLGFGEVRGKEPVNGTEVAMLASDKITLSLPPRPGSMAAWWMEEYGAYIPEDSVYSYLRRLDMIEAED